jgi:ABC-type transporter Mla MlaB component
MEGEARLAGPEEPPTTSVRGVRTPPEANAIHVVISGPITRAAIAGLCERVGVALEGSGADLVVCDVGALVDPDAAMVDALARLQLTARRLGCQVRLRDACGELQELLALVGLGDVVPLCAPLRLESGGQAEDREKALGVEEEADPGDPTG